MRHKAIIVLLLIAFLAVPVSAADVYFSPRGGIEKALVNLIDSADETIDIAMFTFTSKPLAEAVVRAAARGVAVRVYMDDRQAAMKSSVDEYLAANGIPVVFDNRSALMHVKLAIVDGETAALGSFNWTASAERSNEELLIITQDADLVLRLVDWFNSIWRLRHGEDGL